MRKLHLVAIASSMFLLITPLAHGAALQIDEELPIAQEGDPVPDELFAAMGFAPELEPQLRFDRDDFGCASQISKVRLYNYEYEFAWGCENRVISVRRLW